MTGEKKPNVHREVKKVKTVDKTLISSSISNDNKAKLKPHQKAVSNFHRENNITVLLADAGCAKDFVQMYRALDGLQNKEFDKIIICKPIIEASRSIGHMPGSLEEKTDMYLKSFYDNIGKIVGKENVNSVMRKIQFEHVGFQRGNTMPEHSCIILSEVQNLTASEAHTYLTRVPESSKLFINGDCTQSDLGMKSGLNDFLESISGVEGVGIAILDSEKHQMRSKHIVEITKNYIRIQKRKGNLFELDKSKFEYVEF